MCVPGSKRWLVWRHICMLAYLGVACLTLVLRLSCIKQYINPDFLQGRSPYGSSKPYMPPEVSWGNGGLQDYVGPSKFYMSPEVAWEIGGLQDYVAALAARDLADGGTVYARAAFDLDAREPGARSNGFTDWESFLSPAQSHAHLTVVQVPWAWGMLFHRVVDEAGVSSMPSSSSM